MKKKNKNNFKKPRVEEPYGNSYIIESEPINRGINNLKSKYVKKYSPKRNQIVLKLSSKIKHKNV